ncbi:MAG: guanylate kinase [Gemmatimonadetes bacterium]|nr:guanylate kinase [Gemmatimonadota bacterium]
MKTALPSRTAPVVLAAPSGTGKTTIAHALVDSSDDFVFSVSATTRLPRPGERHGEAYEFVSREEFQRMIAKGHLAEWAEVHGNLYGTPVRSLERARELGKYAILDIDVQGARQIRERIPEAVLIFILPPSAEALRERLSVRGTEAPEQVRHRLLTAHRELDEAPRFDYVVVNEDLESAVAGVRTLVEAERHRTTRALDVSAEVGRIQREIERVLDRA